RLLPGEVGALARRDDPRSEAASGVGGRPALLPRRTSGRVQSAITRPPAGNLRLPALISRRIELLPALVGSRRGLLRVLCHEYRRSKRRFVTVLEMKVGPSGSAIRSLIPSHRKLLWAKAMVVSVAEKSGRRSRQARLREASA